MRQDRGVWLVCIALGMTGCLPTPKSQVGWGENWAGKPLHVVLLPASCSSLGDDCEDEYVTGVSGLVASELEFARYSVSNAEKLVLSARTRQDVDVELSRFGEKILAVQSRVQAGSLFEDLSPSQRRALLAEAKAEGLVSIKIQLGESESGTDQSQVQVRLGLGDGSDLGWVARCNIAPAALDAKPSTSRALEMATQCALDAVLKSGGQR